MYRSIRHLATTTCLSAAMIAAPFVVHANPVGGTVSAGGAVISSSGNKTSITQTSDRAVIDWHGFDIGAGETTQFYQPSSSSVTLNRVGGSGPSVIDGQLLANGNIFIINPNGVLFGAHSHVDVNGLVASTADVSNANFMAGKFILDIAGNPNASVINRGTITAKEAGLVGLVAPNVVNSGIITARLGRVHLASGDTATVDLYGDGLLEVAVSDKVKSQLVSNTGIISADGGTIALTAAAGRSVVNSVVTVSGELSAMSVGSRNGRIIIAAEGSNAVAGNVAANKGKKTGSSTVLVDGILDVSGRNAGEHGGSIVITGDNIALLAGTRIDASGYEGLSGTTAGGLISDHRVGSAGGDIEIGGDYLGGGATPTALNLYVDPNVLVLNDAIHSGDAGRTIFWSDGTTQFYGNVYARALGGKDIDPTTYNAILGGNSGDGGFVETSGHVHLDASGYVDLTASSGTRGTYFLDPTDITIYGNVDPTFVSTDGSINLATSLKLWIDAGDTSTVTLSYNSTSHAAYGNSGSNILALNDASGLVVGERIRIGSAGATTLAATMGADTYTIAAISGNTITLSSNLTSTPNGETVYAGYVSKIADKSGMGNDATQTNIGNMPLWLSNGPNGLAVANFNGGNSLNVAGTTNLSLNTSGSIFGVLDYTPGSGAQVWLYKGEYHQNGYYAYAGGLASNTSGVTNSIVLPGTQANNSYYIESYLINGNAGVGYVNGGQSGAAGTYNTVPSNNGLAIGFYAPAPYHSFNGNISEIAVYDATLSGNAATLVNQYESLKWNIALTPPGSGATEAAQAMASTARGDATDGYSAFTTRYLEHLSQSANISLQASNNITLDLKGDTLNLSTAGRSITLTAGNQITTQSTGAITTNNGAITLKAGNGILLNQAVALNSNGGAIVINGALQLGVNSTINAGSGAVDFVSTVNGPGALNATGAQIFVGGDMGSTVALGGVHFTGTTYLNGNIRTDNGNITFMSPVWMEKDITLNAGSGDLTLASTLDSVTGVAASNVQTLVAGGGGGGGFNEGGGGGAGGLLANNAYGVTPNQSLLVAVGQGGIGGTTYTNLATNGGDSSFGSLNALGGGRGANRDSGGAGLTGGSGGGGAGTSDFIAMSAHLPGAGTLGQGFSGAAGSDDFGAQSAGGGGGGAGGAGSIGSGNQAGAGGAGVLSGIAGSSVLYAAGGAGGSTNSPTFSGSNGTGNGGGGGGLGFANSFGGAGGSGAVIVRYTGTSQQAAVIGGTATTIGGDTVWKFAPGTGSFTMLNGCAGICNLTAIAHAITIGGPIGSHQTPVTSSSPGTISLTSTGTVQLPMATGTTITVNGQTINHTIKKTTKERAAIHNPLPVAVQALSQEPAARDANQDWSDNEKIDELKATDTPLISYSIPLQKKLDAGLL